MKKNNSLERIDYLGDINSILEELCSVYDIGMLNNYSVVEEGVEDCNIAITTDKGKFLVKFFSRKRTQPIIKRYIGILTSILEAGVSHPKLLHTLQEKKIYTTQGLSAIVMEFIEGNTFLELNRVPTVSERDQILMQVAKINSLDFKPAFLFDHWAVPHLNEVFEKVRDYMIDSDLHLIDHILEKYKSIPFEELPYCFVHGDIIKGNVIVGDDGYIYILDFSVANWYPRIQDISVIAANLMYEDEGPSLQERCDLLIDDYTKYMDLNEVEKKYLYNYSLAGVGMELLGAYFEYHVIGNKTDELDLWLELGREGLKQEL